MQDVSLRAKTRELTKKSLDSLRRSGMVPGVVYGQGKEAQIVEIPAKKVEQAYMTAGTNRLIELAIDGGKPVNTLFVDVQRNPLTGDFLHFDLYKVKMDEEIDTEIPVHFTGEAPATYNLDGVLVKNLETVEVRALPNKLPESFEVNLESLENINDSIHISDLNIPEGVTVLTEQETLLVKIDPPRSDEELEELEEAIAEDAESTVVSEHGADEEELEKEGESGSETGNTEDETQED